MSIPGFADWLTTPQGRYVMNWEQTQTDAVVHDIFGFHAVQLGLPEVDYLRSSRIAHRVCAADTANAGLRCDLRQLPFAAASLDLVVLPHMLEFHPNPHQLLREVERVLIPEGQIVIIGFNPFSLWGIRRRLPGCAGGFPWSGQYLSVHRLKDWLALLSFEPDRGHFGTYVPPCQQQTWLDRWDWMESAGDRWWPIAGGVYLLRAVKRVHGMRLVKPAWRQATRAASRLAPVVQRSKPQTGNSV